MASSPVHCSPARCAFSGAYCAISLKRHKLSMKSGLSGVCVFAMVARSADSEIGLRAGIVDAVRLE
jgi:hypothetical protein